MPHKRIWRRAARLTLHNLSAHNVGKNAAALAYYMIFALFPLLIFASNLLGLLRLNIGAVTALMGRLLPGDVVGIIEAYLEHISQNSSHLMLWFSLIFSVWFPMRAVHGLTDDVRLAHGLGKPTRPLIYTIRQLVYTVLFLVLAVLILLLTVAGERVMRYLLGHLVTDARLWQALPEVWQYLRFIPLSIFIFIAVGAVYAASLDEKISFRRLLPGIAVAMISWLLITVGFSLYVELFSAFSLIYGALGAFIVLLLWLFFTAFSLILGAEWNAALITVHTQDQTSEEDV